MENESNVLIDIYYILATKNGKQNDDLFLLPNIQLIRCSTYSAILDLLNEDGIQKNFINNISYYNEEFNEFRKLNSKDLIRIFKHKLELKLRVELKNSEDEIIAEYKKQIQALEEEINNNTDN